MKTLKIFFRTCAAVETLGSSRPYGLRKEEITLKCLKSLLESSKGFEKRISLDIVDDSSPKDSLNKIEKVLKGYKIKWKIHTLSWKNNGMSLESTYRLAEKAKEDLIYFCEDDYFHLKEAIPSILNAYDSKIIFTDSFAIFPCDYPKHYREVAPTLVFLGKYNYWRSIAQTTGTFVVPMKLFKRYKKSFYALAEFNKNDHGGEKETINKLWEKEIPCILPMKTLTCHLHTTSLSPFVDWEKEIKLMKL